MLKYLLLAGLVIWLFYSPALRGKRTPSAKAQHKAPQPAHQEVMVRCAHCGMHLPQSEATPGPEGKLYCGAEHRQAGPA